MTTPDLPAFPAARSHRAKAREWMDANPKAMALFDRFAMQMATRGRKFGIGLLTERVRWEGVIARDAGKKYKVDNNYRAYVARDLLRRHPCLAGLLTFRRVGGVR